ncbi:serine O-acetyltransferase [Rhodococcus jostii]|uniref:serine O-acetyltransferase n=1 Tax=Rhodococcus jostii TaxID=132919 RepID=UPI00363B1F7A
MLTNDPFQDWNVNRGRSFIQVVLVLFRVAAFFRKSDRRIVRLAGVPIALLYRSIALSLGGIDIPPSTTIGPRLRIHHGFALVLNKNSVLGSDVTLRHCTTIGAKDDRNRCARVGNGVSIGPNSVLIGDISIGDGAIIGAGSVVVADVLAGTVAMGNPARAANGGEEGAPKHE